MRKDFYGVLGVDKDADEATIKKAYRKLAVQHHPDRNPDDPQAEERFKEISEAYAVLSDPDKRRQYDRLGAAGFEQHFSVDDILNDFNLDDILSQFGLRSSGWGGFRSGGGGPGGGSFFDMFGGRGRPGGAPRQPPPSKGSDAEVPLQISFHEAMHGSERKVSVTIDGQPQSLTVKIPAGIRSGKRIRASGQGHRGPGGRGDLYLKIDVAGDGRFERDGDDLTVEVDVAPSTLLLGGSVEVPTLQGERSLRIKPGTATDRRVRIKGAGAPRLGQDGTRGDLYVQLVVRTPAALDDAQQVAAEALRDAGL